MKLYLASLQAQRLLRITDHNDGSQRYARMSEHAPGIISAETIQDAANHASDMVFEKYPVSEAWGNHDAHIVPVTEAVYYDKLEPTLGDGGVLELSEEAPQHFKFFRQPSSEVNKCTVTDSVMLSDSASAKGGKTVGAN